MDSFILREQIKVALVFFSSHCRFLSFLALYKSSVKLTFNTFQIEKEKRKCVEKQRVQNVVNRRGPVIKHFFYIC